MLRPLQDQSETALERIRKTGRIDVITEYDATSYFLYRGTPKGFNYELLRAFSDQMGVQLNIKPSSGLESTYSSLGMGDADMVAISLPVTQERNLMSFQTEPLFHARPVLVQRSGGDLPPVRDQKKLGGKTIVVEKGSPFIRMLTMLSFEIKDSIEIVEHPELKTEQLVHAVSTGQIDYTLAYEHVAQVYYRMHHNLDIRTQVGHGQNLVWLVSRDGEDLLEEFNDWLTAYRKSKKFHILYDKYFKKERSLRIVGNDMYSVNAGKISKYDSYIRKYSKWLNWDWRLVAALIYKESKFHPEAQAWSGAYGLMQLMPDVMEKYGVDSVSHPEKQIEAGVKYLVSLDKQFRPLVPDQNERIKFVLAAYNVGLGHVLDARRLAVKYGKRNDIWKNQVDSFLLLKSDPHYYQDRMAYYGYCRGEEPFVFVNDVMEIYQLYRNAIRN